MIMLFLGFSFLIFIKIFFLEDQVHSLTHSFFPFFLIRFVNGLPCFTFFTFFVDFAERKKEREKKWKKKEAREEMNESKTKTGKERKKERKNDDRN